eukprot:CAMPEP_0206478374 /NCGR_PEP_ID=MMETSP0324_2-20121206/35986_1 /ASSEMBLY_ACC=CAM_ASM_000836 /TAXON_ID=2866 /ORGANISM="Crypthecodinium cohnii, Strain Seligo" /LENGTH=352 /DNA_ID=CAMNT_0053954609 /DNA_START=3 /DNA_END=1061 /DNA_ORIENTATION=-
MPVAPPAVRAIASQDWGALDEDFDYIDMGIPDSGSVRQHLLSTFGMLNLWGQTAAQQRAVEAEELVALISSDAMTWENIASSLLSGYAPDFATLPCGTVSNVTRRQFAHAAVVAVADIAECAHEVVYLDSLPTSSSTSSAVEGKTEEAAKTAAAAAEAAEEEQQNNSSKPTPSSSSTAPRQQVLMPAVEMYWMSQLMEQFRGDMKHVPPIFDGCTRTIDRATELRARDIYWQIAQQQDGQDPEFGQISYLEEVIALNPFIAEPHVLLSQALLQRRRWAEAAHHSSRALEIFFQWGTAWDKRAPMRQWVAYAQMLLQQASVGQERTSEMPYVQTQASLQDVSGPIIHPVVMHC